jgi:hypothetical protein
MDGKKFVLVTTEHRGVFVGFGPTAPDAKKNIVLTGAKMIVYWPSECHGVLGLAAEGPKRGAKIGPSVPSITLAKVTAVAECSDAATKAFDHEYWS